MPADVVQIAPEQKLLSADDILVSDDQETLDIYVKEWKGTVSFRAMTADVAIGFQDRLKGPQARQAIVVLFQLCAVDRDGMPLFTPAKLETLRKKSWPVFLRLQKPLMQLNGFLQPDKSLDTVRRILTESGVEENIIERVSASWKADDEDTLKND